MDSDTINIIHHNLTILLNAKKNCIHKSKFVNIDDQQLHDLDRILNIMINEYLIETERDDDIYYLTEYGYDCAEWGKWPSHKSYWDFTCLDNDEFNEDINDDFNRNVIDSKTPKVNMKQVVRVASIVFLLVAFTLIMLGLLLSKTQ